MSRNTDASRVAPAYDLVLGDPGSGPRLLLLSYHFPPSGTAGALRWQKLAGLAAERGWGVDVVMVDPASAPVLDAGRLDDLPRGTRIRFVPVRRSRLERLDDVKSALATVVRAVFRRMRSTVPMVGASANTSGAAAGSASSTADAAGLPETLVGDQIRFRPFELRSWMRAYNCVVQMSATRTWARDAASAGLRVARPGTHRLLVTCGPPHMIHDTGRRVAHRLGVPHVVDMRDPWALERRIVEPFASPLWFALASRLERRVVRDADLVVTNTDAVRVAMTERHPDARIVTVMNGFDAEPLPSPLPVARFTIRYAGAIYIDRDPQPLFHAARRVVDTLGLTPAEFGIELMGDVKEYAGRGLEEIAEGEGMSAFLTVHAPRPRAEALAFMAAASMLVSLPQDSPWAVPSKIFEYMRFPAWLLALTDRGSAIDTALRDGPADLAEPRNADAIAAILERRIRQHCAGELARPLVDAYPHFSRRAQADRLFSELEALVVAEALFSPSGARIAEGVAP